MTSDYVAFLIDTNVLVYTLDPRDTAKQDRATAVLDALIESGEAVLSAQCLSEFFAASTRRLPEPLTASEAHAGVERFSRVCRVLDVTPAVVLEGCRGVVAHGMSLWDALIWAAAKLNQIPYVLTEDAEHGRFLEGVRFLNPFRADFALDSLPPR
ncbi:MAG TPA: PIN domain-containing protein [Chloroflexota bacterium]|nr:PIN domain-containing protein [Chloroflexota bacterium]